MSNVNSARSMNMSNKAFKKMEPVHWPVKYVLMNENVWKLLHLFSQCHSAVTEHKRLDKLYDMQSEKHAWISTLKKATRTSS